MTGYEVVYYALAAATAATAGYSAYESGKATEASNKAQAEAADYNAEIAKQNADIARRNAGAREDALRAEQRQVLAKQRAAAAESGFDSASGSLGLLQENSADRAELDALMVRYGGESEARGYKSQSALDEFGGRVSRMNARNARNAGNIGAGSSLLTSASSSYRGGLKINPQGGGG
jgi:hypothetical protein